MRRILGSIDTVDLLVIIMIIMTVAGLIIPRIHGKGGITPTRTYHATGTAPADR